MEQLCYGALKEEDGYILRQAPERVIQFGDGNFLRGFADYFVDVLNEKTDFQGKIVVVPPVSAGKAERLNAQEGLYQLCLRGVAEGLPVERRRLISSISRALDVYEEYGSILLTAHDPNMRFVISNTTEAGIIFDPSCKFDDRPPASFPAKLTRLLWERYQTGLPGYILLPCELIERNGEALRDCVLKYAAAWGLEDGFHRWVEAENHFCNTLVDRIVTGPPKDVPSRPEGPGGCRDALLVTAEPFALWVIEGPDTLAREFPAPQAGLPVMFVPDCRPYREQKVRILNGGHTALAPVAFLLGHDFVRTGMEDSEVRAYLEGLLFEEVIPTLSLPRAGCERFARAVEERFSNPYMDHRLLDIALNSTSKWRTRVLPSVTAYQEKTGALPRRLVFSFAALMALYLQGQRAGESYSVRDGGEILAFFSGNQGMAPEALVRALSARADVWGRDLNALPGFSAAAGRALADILTRGMAAALASCNGEAAV